MFLRSDVERLAKAVWGDVQAHLQKKQAAADERKRKMEDKKRAHIESGTCPGVRGCLYCGSFRRQQPHVANNTASAGSGTGGLIRAPAAVAGASTTVATYIEISDDDDHDDQTLAAGAVVDLTEDD